MISLQKEDSLLVFVDVTGRQKVFCYTGLVELGKTSNKKDARRTNDQSPHKVEKDINRREKALQAYLQGIKLTQCEIDFATDPNAVFKFYCDQNNIMIVACTTLIFFIP